MAIARAERRLAAIMVADIVGYSSMIERNEARTLASINAARTEVINPLLAAHGGRVAKLMGDGTIVEFGSVVDAVACAVALQHALRANQTNLPQEQRIVLRVGINLGDVVVRDGDLLGDGVNIAARVEALAESGGISITEAVMRQLSGKTDVLFDDAGEHRLKNISLPIRVYRFRDQSPSADQNRQSLLMQLASSARASIAVLPFTNMSGDPGQDYFSDGVADDIITDLSKISALGVVARNTSFQFKGKSVDVSQIAQQLRVSHVLEGSVRKAGDRVRISAQLIDGASGNHIWADRYDRNINDIFALQDEISETVVKALKLKLLPQEREAIERRSTTSPAAYDLYLMARQYSVMGTLRHRSAIVRLCRRALEIDPSYARAWALLSIGLSFLRISGGTEEGGMDAAERAIALDPSLADAHVAKARVLTGLGRYDEAVAALNLAFSLDPESYEVNAAAARCAVAMHRHDDAIGYLEKAAAVYPTDFWALGMAIQEYNIKGDKAGEMSAAHRALDRIENILASEPDHGTAMSFGVSALISLGENDRALDWAERAQLLDPDNTNMHHNLACSMVKMGQTDRALELLAKTFERIQPDGLRWMELDTELDPIRGDPRFRSMLAAAQARLAATET